MQGARWRRLDNTAKIFPGITNEDLSNVFRVSMVLKEEVDPELLEEALERVLPALEGFRVKLRRGFFWYYFETNRRTPKVEREAVCPCRYIDPHSHQLFLFRVSYFERKINLEVFHALTDGLGGVNFLKALVCEYLRLKRESREQRPGQNKAEASHMYRIWGRRAARPGKKKKRAADDEVLADAPPHDVEDSYKKHYRKIKRRKYATAEAFQLDGDCMPLDVCSVVHGTMDAGALREAARARGSGNFRIIIRQILPNTLSPLIVDSTLRIGTNIMMISGLSFIGLGVQPPTPEWGSILNTGREFITTFWPMITFPGIAIMLTMFGFNVMGDGLRDALDPKLKH